MQSMFRHDLLAGKRILVTGGGTGLGEESICNTGISDTKPKNLSRT